MVMPRPVRADPVKSKVVVCTGGINESVSTLELQPGELLRCQNYMEIDGQYSGYASAPPYEVYDGTQLASAVAATLTSTDPVTGEETWDDADREARRAAIQPVPGSGAALGVHIYDESVYAVRNSASGAEARLFQATDSGWLQLGGTQLSPSGDFRWANARFAKYPEEPSGSDYPPVTTNTVCMFFVDGVSKPHSWDGYTVRVIDDTNLPSNAGFSPAPVYPTHVGAFENRLFLAFPGGHLFFCALGDPSDWSAANGAGAIPLGGEVTNIVNGPGNTLIVFLEDGIRLIKSISTTDAGEFTFEMDEFSNATGAIADTAVRMLGDIFFADNRGPTSLKATDQFGDFEESMFAEKTQRTFLSRKENITVAIAAREYNQYRLFFSDNTALFYTFTRGKLKGSGLMRFNKTIVKAAEGKMPNTSTGLFFIADETTGYVYKMDSGTSFNGESIETFFTTAYYHYNSPRNWKHFLSLTFEITADNGMTFLVSTDYDYNDPLLPSNPYREATVDGLGGSWGDVAWGSFIWGGAYIQRPVLYVYGYGTTMSVTVRTTDKYRSQHIIHNYIADYTVHDRRV